MSKETIISGRASYGVPKHLQLFHRDMGETPVAKFARTTTGAVLEITNAMQWDKVPMSDFVIFGAVCLFNCIPAQDYDNNTNENPDR